MREDLTKDTFETLKKLKVINESARREIQRIEEKEKAAKKNEDFDDDYWYESDEMQAVRDIITIILLVAQ